MNKAVLNTQTNILKDGVNLGIFTFYNESDRNILAFISDAVKNVNNIPFKEGELGFTFDNWGGITFQLTSKGELIVIGDEANKFSIYPDGDLIYTN